MLNRQAKWGNEKRKVEGGKGKVDVGVTGKIHWGIVTTYETRICGVCVVVCMIWVLWVHWKELE